MSCGVMVLSATRWPLTRSAYSTWDCNSPLSHWVVSYARRVLGAESQEGVLHHGAGPFDITCEMHGMPSENTLVLGQC
jgi:hypothetical protein